jgi:hypothetical protein
VQLGAAITNGAAVVVVLRGSTSTGNEYQLIANAGALSVYKIVSSTQTQIGSTYSITLNGGDKVMLCAVGSSPVALTVYRNGGELFATSDTSSTVTSGYPGMQAFSNGSAVTDAQVSAWGAYPATGSASAGAVTMSASNPITYPEWFGAKGNGVTGSGCSGTDDTTAIQLAINSLATYGGELFLSPKIYQTSSALSMVANLVTLSGVPYAGGESGIHQTEILNCGATDNDQVDITGASSSANVFFPAINNILFERSAAGTTPGAAIRTHYATWPQLNRTLASDSFYGFYLDNTTSNFHGQDLVVIQPLGAISNSVGYYISGEQNTGVCLNCWANAPAYGIYLYGSVDFTFIAPNLAADGSYGIYAPTGVCEADVHFINPVIDTQGGQAISINGNSVTSGCSASGTSDPLITFSQLFASVGGTPMVYIANSEGIKITGGEIVNYYASSTVLLEITGSLSQGNLVSGLKLVCSDGILIAGGATDNTIANNELITRGTGSTITTGISSTGSSQNVFTGNVLLGTETTGISFDGTSGGNRLCANYVDTTGITTAYSDSDGANAYCSTTTSAPSH